MKKRISALALIALVALSACSAAKNDSATLYQASNDYAAATTSAAFERRELKATGGTGESEKQIVAGQNPGEQPNTAEISVTGQAASDIGRKLIRTGYYTLETMDFLKTIQQIEELVNTAGGYIQSSTNSGGGSLAQGYSRPQSASYTVRVPSESFFSLGSSLADIATVTYSSQNAEEVTDYYYDTEARLKTLRVQEERLLTLMGQATELEAIILLENSLSDVRYQIESQQGTLRRLDSLISFSTLHIEVSEVFTPSKIEPVPITLGERIRSRFANTLDDMKLQAESMIVVLIGDAPQLLLNLAMLALIVWVAVIIVKKFRKKSAAKAPQIREEKPDSESKE